MSATSVWSSISFSPFLNKASFLSKKYRNIVAAIRLFPSKKIRKRHGGQLTGYVGGGRIKARRLKQRNGHGVSGNSQPNKAAPYRQPKAENCHRRPFTGVHGLPQLRRVKSRWYNRKGTQQRVLTVILGSPARCVPLCGIPEAADFLSPTHIHKQSAL